MKINLATFSKLAQPDQPIKIGRVLHGLCCGNSYNRFDAEKQLADHALNSTISALANDHHIEINRQWEIVPGYRGKATMCVRYSIKNTQENLTRCYWLLKSWGWKDQQSGMELPPPPEAA